MRRSFNNLALLLYQSSGREAAWTISLHTMNYHCKVARWWKCVIDNARRLMFFWDNGGVEQYRLLLNTDHILPYTSRLQISLFPVILVMQLFLPHRVLSSFHSTLLRDEACATWVHAITRMRTQVVTGANSVCWNAFRNTKRSKSTWWKANIHVDEKRSLCLEQYIWCELKNATDGVLSLKMVYVIHLVRNNDLLLFLRTICVKYYTSLL